MFMSPWNVQWCPPKARQAGDLPKSTQGLRTRGRCEVEAAEWEVGGGHTLLGQSQGCSGQKTAGTVFAASEGKGGFLVPTPALPLPCPTPAPLFKIVYFILILQR